MNWKQGVIAAVILLFGAYSVVPVYQHGYVGTFQLSFANSATTQVGLDLIIALSLIVMWMWADAREHGLSPIPFVLITVLAGSFGPLLYLFRRCGTERR